MNFLSKKNKYNNNKGRYHSCRDIHFLKVKLDGNPELTGTARTFKYMLSFMSDQINTLLWAFNLIYSSSFEEKLCVHLFVCLFLMNKLNTTFKKIQKNT